MPKHAVTQVTSGRWCPPERQGDSMLMIPGSWEPEDYTEITIDVPSPIEQGVELPDFVGTRSLCFCAGDESCEDCPNWGIYEEWRGR
jgi:hypothetical protein